MSSMFVKVVRYTEDRQVGFSIYGGERLHVHPDLVSIEGSDGAVHIHLGSPEDAAPLRFFVMNHEGTTFEQFRGDWLMGSPDRATRALPVSEDAPSRRYYRYQTPAAGWQGYVVVGDKVVEWVAIDGEIVPADKIEGHQPLPPLMDYPEQGEGTIYSGPVPQA